MADNQKSNAKLKTKILPPAIQPKIKFNKDPLENGYHTVKKPKKRGRFKTTLKVAALATGLLVGAAFLPLKFNSYGKLVSSSLVAQDTKEVLPLDSSYVKIAEQNGVKSDITNTVFTELEKQKEGLIAKNREISKEHGKPIIFLETSTDIIKIPGTEIGIAIQPYGAVRLFYNGQEYAHNTEINYKSSPNYEVDFERGVIWLKNQANAKEAIDEFYSNIKQRFKIFKYDFELHDGTKLSMVVVSTRRDLPLGSVYANYIFAPGVNRGVLVPFSYSEIVTGNPDAKFPQFPPFDFGVKIGYLIDKYEENGEKIVDVSVLFFANKDTGRLFGLRYKTPKAPDWIDSIYSTQMTAEKR